MAVAPYIIFEKQLLKTKTVLNKETNIQVELNGNMKILYRYMLDRFLFFKSLGNEFYDNQDELAYNLAMSKRTIVSLIKSLLDVGLVEKKTARYSGVNNSNSYIIHDMFDCERFDTFTTVVCANKKVLSLDVKELTYFDDEEF